jgi:histone acetyltransferase (RNA polymerase elongator complex component)
LKKELKSNPDKAKKLYSRLYWNYELVNSGKQLKIKDNCEWDEIKTTIIGQKPDLESYRNFVCLDTRSREIRNKYEKWNKQDGAQPNLVIRQYESSVWREFFISFEDLQGYIYWFTRLLLPDSEETIERDWLWKDTALIRELHIYGQLAWLKENVDSNDQKQHHWFGSQLLSMAEQISKNNWYKNLSVISWVWVRKYYEKQWYSLVGTYMVKWL